MKTKDIIEKLKTTLEVFDQCSVIFEDIKYIGVVEDKEMNIIEDSNFLMRQIDYEWRILIVELYKIYKKDEHYSIIKILNILINDYKSIHWENQIDIDVLKSYQLKIEDRSFQRALTALNILRTKFVGHLDAKRKTYNDEITTEQVQLLMSFGEDVLRKVYNSLTANIFLFNQSLSGISGLVSQIIDLKEGYK